ncbi:MAG: class I SAM-dependent methyltransferase [Acidimicrobiales bacterium]|jgi:SAM-dependent methyltransferase
MLTRLDEARSPSSIQSAPSVRAEAARREGRPSSKRTLRRSVELFKAFRLEQTDPDSFYDLMAADTTKLLGEHLRLDGACVLDVGGGAGYFTKAFRAAGASCFVAEPSIAELSWRGARPSGAVIGDGYELPFQDACADLVVSSNVLEHVPRPLEMIDELTRVARPGGHVWISFTNWYGPWGGHETSPWHYLGGERAARHFESRTGRAPKNVFGTSLFAVHVGPTLRYVRQHPQLDVIEAGPRYHPWFARGVVHVPGVREVVTWNLELLLQRRPDRFARRWRERTQVAPRRHEGQQLLRDAG